MGIWLMCICILVILAISFGVSKGLDDNGVWYLRKNSITGKIEWQHKYIDADMAAMIFGLVLIIVAFVMLGFLVGFTIAWHIDITYDLLEAHRADLINLYNASTESNKNVILGDIVEFNDKLRSLQLYYNNPWFSWFVSSRVMDIQTITI